MSSKLPYVYFPTSNLDPDIDGELMMNAQTDYKNEAGKGEGNPIMTPDERAWNDRMIKSFFTKRSIIDAVVLSPTGIVIATLGRQVEMRMKDMDPGSWIRKVLITSLILKALLIIGAISGGIFVIRVVNAFDGHYVTSSVLKISDEEAYRLRGSSSIVLSIIPIHTKVTIYNQLNQSIYSESWLTESTIHNRWIRARKHIEIMIAELMMGQKYLLSNPYNDSSQPLMWLSRKPDPEVMPVPNCFQDKNKLRIVWNDLLYSFIVYLVALGLHVFLLLKEVLLKSIPHFADPRDRKLSPEQMKSSINIGLEGVVALQKVCFITKLLLVFNAFLMGIFMRAISTIQEVRALMTQLADELMEAEFPPIVVRYSGSAIYIFILDTLLHCVVFCCLHFLAKYYSLIATTKLPQVKICSSMDESYVR